MSEFKLALKKYLLVFAGLVSAGAIAHNQNPAAIRRAMDKAFGSLSAPLPPNVLKGNRLLRIGGSSAQVFEAKKNGVLVGQVAQVEFQEVIHVIAVSSDGSVKAVVRDGSMIESGDWATIPAVEEFRKIVANSVGPPPSPTKKQ